MKTVSLLPPNSLSHWCPVMQVYLDTAPLAECRGSRAASIRYEMEKCDDGSTVLVKAYKGETYLGRLS